VFPVRYKLGVYIPEDGILHSHRRENLKSYKREVDSSYVVLLLITECRDVSQTSQKLTKGRRRSRRSVAAGSTRIICI
jgi:hypothetical protein